VRPHVQLSLVRLSNYLCGEYSVLIILQMYRTCRALGARTNARKRSCIRPSAGTSATTYKRGRTRGRGERAGLLPAFRVHPAPASHIVCKARKDCACLPLRFPPFAPPPRESVGLRDFNVGRMEGWSELYPRECALDGSGRGAGDVTASVAPGDSGQEPGGLKCTHPVLRHFPALHLSRSPCCSELTVAQRTPPLSITHAG
jgi:hypothetical protein